MIGILKLGKFNIVRKHSNIKWRFREVCSHHQSVVIWGSGYLTKSS